MVAWYLWPCIRSVESSCMGFGMDASFHLSPYRVLYKEIRVVPKIRVLHSETLFQTD